MSYLKYWQSVGAKAVPRSVDIPDFRLGIDKAENLESVPIKLSAVVANRKVVTEDARNQPYEKVAYNGLSDGVHETMFETGADAMSLWDAIEFARGEV